MAMIKCKMCGGDLNLIEGASTAECEYCGSLQTVPKVDDEKKLTLFARANRLRTACEFDKAAGIYETIVADFPEESEAYWGLVLCKYGIEYVDDPATGKKIPTCHRSSFDSVMEDSDLEQAMENADSAARRVYREEAKVIEEIRRGIISVSSNEQPYDIFICYKETDDDGNRTLDSVLAQDVYDALTDRGYRVFFSRITLEDKLGVEYEPYIFAALNSAKIMLAFGTDYEYYNAVWVKNEWSRYLKLMAKDKEKYLIPCFKGIDAYDMPKEFAKLQAQDLGKLGAIQDLLRGVEKLLPKQTEGVTEVVVAQPQVVASSNPTTESYLKRAFMFLEDMDWRSAAEYCEKVLDIDPENGRAYLGKLMAELRIPEEERLVHLQETFDSRTSYQKAIRFGDEQLRSFLEGCTEAIIRRKEDVRLAALEKHYCTATSLMEQGTVAALREAAEEFNEIPDYKDAGALAQQCTERRMELLREAREKAAAMQQIFTVSPHVEYPMHAVTNAKGKVFVSCQDKYRSAISTWDDIVSLSMGEYHALGAHSDGSVCARGDNKYGQCDVQQWRAVKAIAAGGWHSVGLKQDGTVIAVGLNEEGECRVANWRDIVQISAGRRHTVGLKKNGTVLATGYRADGRCEVGSWKDVAKVYAYNGYTVGLKKDGTVLCTSKNFNVSKWTDIVDIAVAYEYLLGLRADGTVVSVGSNKNKQGAVSGWNDIVAVSALNLHSVGLKADGTVVATGLNENNQCDVSKFKDIVAVSVGMFLTLGIRKDGTVACAGQINSQPYIYLRNWKLFTDPDTYLQERQAYRDSVPGKIAKAEEAYAAKCKLEADRRAQNLCQHCGGQLKGLFTKKCVDCGRPKDYE